MIAAALRRARIGVANRWHRQTWLIRNAGRFIDRKSQTRKPRLYVDLSVILRNDAGTGIQRVVRALWLGLSQRHLAQFDVVPVLASSQAGYCHVSGGLAGNRLPKGCRAGDPVAAGPGDVFLGLDLAAHLLPWYRRQFRAWKNAGVQCHFVVYDLLPHSHPQFFRPITRRKFARWLEFVAEHADRILCISRDVADQVAVWLQGVRGGKPLPRLLAFPLGADIAASAPTRGLPPGAEDFIASLAGKPWVLMVGTIEPRKGYAQALDAFELLWGRDDPAAPILAIVGRPGWLSDDLQSRLSGHAEQGRHLFWLDDVSDEYLQRIYAACHGVLLASWAEGYGLPLVEAASHGKPVLCRDLPVFRECASGDVSFFASSDGAGLAQALHEWIAGLADHPQGHGIAVTARNVTWDDSLDALIACINT